MTITKAQEELLQQLENGAEVTFVGGHYTVLIGDKKQKIWPSTFYGLYDQRMVERLPSGNYTVSDYGKQQIRSKGR